MPIIPVMWQCLNVLPKTPVLEILPQHSCVMGGPLMRGIRPWRNMDWINAILLGAGTLAKENFIISHISHLSFFFFTFFYRMM